LKNAELSTSFLMAPLNVGTNQIVPVQGHQMDSATQGCQPVGKLGLFGVKFLDFSYFFLATENSVPFFSFSWLFFG
jgi:hypothetical protein